MDIFGRRYRQVCVKVKREEVEDYAISANLQVWRRKEEDERRDGTVFRADYLSYPILLDEWDFISDSYKSFVRTLSPQTGEGYFLNNGVSLFEIKLQSTSKKETYSPPLSWFRYEISALQENLKGDKIYEKTRIYHGTPGSNVDGPLKTYETLEAFYQKYLSDESHFNTTAILDLSQYWVVGGVIADGTSATIALLVPHAIRSRSSGQIGFLFRKFAYEVYPLKINERNIVRVFNSSK